MRERPRPEPPSPPPSCFCLTRSKRCVALGVAAALAAAGTLKWTLPSNRHSPSPLAPGGGDATKASPGVSSPAVDDKGVEGPGGKQGGGESGAGAQSSLPRCFSSPEADPSDGAWRKTDHGVCDSPAHLAAGWSLPTHQFDFLRRCDETWNDQDHPGPKVPRPYWEWEPAKCSLEAVDEAKFCRVMKGRKGVLLVGDSLTRLMTTTLATVLRADGVSTDTFKDNWQACGGDLKVRFMRNDYLDTRTAPRYKSLLCEQGVGGGPQAENTRCRIFATDETLGEFDTLVVNSGAHPRGAPEYGRQMDAAAEALTEAMHRLHGRDRAVLVVRNTAPGHWGCTERMFDGPVDEALAEELVNNAPEKYQWGTFHDRNAQLEEAFSAEKGWRLLDGPADHWVTLLYNVLLDATGGTE